MHIARGTRWAIAGWLALVTALVPGLAQAQSRVGGLTPQALIQAGETASGPAREEIEDALFAKRAAALPVLRQELATGTSGRKLFAAGVIAQMRDGGSLSVLLTATRDADERVRTRALTALRSLGDPSAAPRVRQIVRAGRGHGELKVALAALGKLGAGTDAALARPHLSHADEEVRVMAAGALAMLGSAEGEALLLAATHSPNPLAQKNAVYALGFLHSPTAATARLQEILDEPAAEWKSYVHMALAEQERAGRDAATQASVLSRAAQGRDRLVAEWAIEQLSELDAPEGTQALRSLVIQGGRLGQRAARRVAAREGQ